MRLAIVLIVTLLIPVIPFAVVGELPGEQWLSTRDDHAFRFGATGTALLAGDVLLPIPSSIVGSLLGARLGFIPGFLCAWFGLVAGSLIGYAVGRLLLSRLSPDLPQTPTLLILFISRPVPVFAEAVSFAAGAGRMGWLPFLAASAAGNSLYALALAGNGAALLPAALVGPGLVLPMALPVVAWLFWRSLSRKPPTP